MSILSIITACLVLFFQYPVKIGDRIRVFAQDHWVEGEPIAITYFLVFVRTEHDGVIPVRDSALLKENIHSVRSGELSGGER